MKAFAVIWVKRMINGEARDKTIRALYQELTANKLPNVNEKEKHYYFDESTGTYYSLTGKKQIERPNIELAKKYFESILGDCRTTDLNSPNYQKACYLAIAIDCIETVLKNQ